MIDGVIAFVGRPNTGKSSLFNRIIGNRLSIVDETAGVTRDRIYGAGSWLTKELRFIDTGGLQLADQPFRKEIEFQVNVAIDESDVIVLVVDGQTGLTDDDLFVARKLRKSDKPVIVAVNKVDDQHFANNLYDYYKLGFDILIPTSTEHGIGIGDLLDEIIHLLPDQPIKDDEEALRFCVIGRPNVGKSSLVNKLLREDRVIVSDQEGTTRDAVDTLFQADHQTYRIIDTAGLRKRGKITDDVEKYAVMRAMKAIDRSDVVLFLFDAAEGIRQQDKHVAGYAHEAGKPLIIVANKWDAVDKTEIRTDQMTEKIRKEFVYLDYAPIVFLSAKTGQRVHTLLPLIHEVFDNANRRLSTSVVNEVLNDAITLTPPPTHQGKPLRVYYATQVSVCPPTFVVFVNDPKLLHFSYERYLENRFREAFDFKGTPIHMIIRKKERL